MAQPELDCAVEPVPHSLPEKSFDERSSPTCFVSSSGTFSTVAIGAHYSDVEPESSLNGIEAQEMRSRNALMQEERACRHELLRQMLLRILGRPRAQSSTAHSRIPWSSPRHQKRHSLSNGQDLARLTARRTPRPTHTASSQPHVSQIRRAFPPLQRAHSPHDSCWASSECSSAPPSGDEDGFASRASSVSPLSMFGLESYSGPYGVSEHLPPLSSRPSSGLSALQGRSPNFYPLSSTPVAPVLRPHSQHLVSPPPVLSPPMLSPPVITFNHHPRESFVPVEAAPHAQRPAECSALGTVPLLTATPPREGAGERERTTPVGTQPRSLYRSSPFSTDLWHEAGEDTGEPLDVTAPGQESQILVSTQSPTTPPRRQTDSPQQALSPSCQLRVVPGRVSPQWTPPRVITAATTTTTTATPIPTKDGSPTFQSPTRGRTRVYTAKHFFVYSPIFSSPLGATPCFSHRAFESFNYKHEEALSDLYHNEQDAREAIYAKSQATLCLLNRKSAAAKALVDLQSQELYLRTLIEQDWSDHHSMVTSMTKESMVVFRALAQQLLQAQIDIIQLQQQRSSDAVFAEERLQYYQLNISASLALSQCRLTAAQLGMRRQLEREENFSRTELSTVFLVCLGQKEMFSEIVNTERQERHILWRKHEEETAEILRAQATAQNARALVENFWVNFERTRNIIVNEEAFERSTLEAWCRDAATHLAFWAIEVDEDCARAEMVEDEETQLHKLHRVLHQGIQDTCTAALARVLAEWDATRLQLSTEEASCRTRLCIELRHLVELQQLHCSQWQSFARALERERQAIVVDEQNTRQRLQYTLTHLCELSNLRVLERTRLEEEHSAGATAIRRDEAEQRRQRLYPVWYEMTEAARIKAFDFEMSQLAKLYSAARQDIVLEESEAYIRLVRGVLSERMRLGSPQVLIASPRAVLRNAGHSGDTKERSQGAPAYPVQRLDFFDEVPLSHLIDGEQEKRVAVLQEEYACRVSLASSHKYITSSLLCELGYSQIALEEETDFAHITFCSLWQRTLQHTLESEFAARNSVLRQQDEARKALEEAFLTGHSALPQIGQSMAAATLDQWREGAEGIEAERSRDFISMASGFLETAEALQRVETCQVEVWTRLHFATGFRVETQRIFDRLRAFREASEYTALQESVTRETIVQKHLRELANIVDWRNDGFRKLIFASFPSSNPPSLDESASDNYAAPDSSLNSTPKVASPASRITTTEITASPSLRLAISEKQLDSDSGRKPRHTLLSPETQVCVSSGPQTEAQAAAVPDQGSSPLASPSLGTFGPAPQSCTNLEQKHTNAGTLYAEEDEAPAESNWSVSSLTPTNTDVNNTPSPNRHPDRPLITAIDPVNSEPAVLYFDDVYRTKRRMMRKKGRRQTRIPSPPPNDASGITIVPSDDEEVVVIPISPQLGSPSPTRHPEPVNGPAHEPTQAVSVPRYSPSCMASSQHLPSSTPTVVATATAAVMAELVQNLSIQSGDLTIPRPRDGECSAVSQDEQELSLLYQELALLQEVSDGLQSQLSSRPSTAVPQSSPEPVPHTGPPAPSLHTSSVSVPSVNNSAANLALPNSVITESSAIGSGEDLSPFPGGQSLPVMPEHYVIYRPQQSAAQPSYARPTASTRSRKQAVAEGVPTGNTVSVRPGPVTGSWRQQTLPNGKQQLARISPPKPSARPPSRGSTTPAKENVPPLTVSVTIPAGTALAHTTPRKTTPGRLVPKSNVVPLEGRRGSQAERSGTSGNKMAVSVPQNASPVVVHHIVSQLGSGLVAESRHVAELVQHLKDWGYRGAPPSTQP
eukprot:TRINITY_DN7459_c0_g1_i2.p1 TRINITY_DN7459_c0_g1~~TRINITY_DN7459_c0_g1_i2.p1  ORF type:complete len:1803 (-),score=213.20 TRINITY_DN7459_c0_g1_i2:37-5445(-)